MALSTREGVPVGVFRALGIAWAVFSPCGGLQCLKVSHQLCVPSCTSWAQAFYCLVSPCRMPPQRDRAVLQHSMTGWREQAGHLLLTGHVVALLLRTSPSVLKAGKSKRGTPPSWPTLPSHTLSFQQTDLRGRDSPFTKLESIGPCVCTPDGAP